MLLLCIDPYHLRTYHQPAMLIFRRREVETENGFSSRRREPRCHVSALDTKITTALDIEIATTLDTKTDRRRAAQLRAPSRRTRLLPADHRHTAGH